MSPPFINDYKKSFALKRICQTFLGGPRLFSHPVSIVLQITIFTLPALLLSIVHLVDSSTNIFWRCLVVGISLVLLEIFLNFTLFLLKKGHQNVAPSESLNNFLSEEDQNDYEGFFKGSTWTFIAPNSSVSPVQILAIFSSSLSFALCTPLVFHQNVSAVVRGFAIFSLSIGRYTAVINVSPEVATFDPIRRLVIRFYRPFYTGLVGISYLGALMVAEADADSCAYVFVLLLALLPIFWSLGILPPLDALLPWTLDSIARMFGGIPSFHHFGTVISIGMGIVATILAFVAAGQNPILLVVLECVFAYIMTSDIGSILNMRSSFCEDTPAKLALLRLLKPTLAILTSICILIMTIVTEINIDFREGLTAITLTVATTSFIIRHLLMMRKYPAPKLFVLMYAMWDGILMYILQIWITIELTDEDRKRSLSVQSLLNLIDYMLTIRAFSQTICNPKMTALDLTITSLLKYSSTLSSTLGLSETGSSWTQFSYIISLFIVSHIRQRVFRGIRFFRMIVVVWHAFLVTPLLEEKWKMGLVALCAYPISMMSLSIATLVEGSTLTPLFTLPIFIVGFPRPNSFWKARWLPKRATIKQITANEADGKSLDWTIYAQIAPILTRNLVRKAYKARMRLDESHYFVARYEDRLIFLHVITCGWNFMYIHVKGLEMQEQTSCHHQEAAWMDEYLEKAFGVNARVCFAFTSPTNLRNMLMSSVKPQTALLVSTYAESKSVLNSLKTKEEFIVFQHMFCRAFSYLWIKKNPVFKGESYQRPIASGYHFFPPAGIPGGSSIINISDEGSLDEKDSDDEEDRQHNNQSLFNYGHNGPEQQNKFSMSRALFDYAMGNVSAISGYNTFNPGGTGIMGGGGGGGSGGGGGAVCSTVGSVQNSLVAPVVQMVMPNRDAWSNGGNGGFNFPYLPGMGGDNTNSSGGNSVFASTWRDDPNRGFNNNSSNTNYNNSQRNSRMTMADFFPNEGGIGGLDETDIKKDNQNYRERSHRPPLTQSSSISSSTSSPVLSTNWPGLNAIWIRKCVGESIPSNAVKARVEKLCLKAWKIILGRDEDLVEIDLAQFFKEDFWKKWNSSKKLTKLSSLGKISVEEITMKAFRYAAKLTLDEIYSGSIEIDGIDNIFNNNEAKEEEIFHELTLYEKNHKFCSPKDIPMHIDDRQKHIVSMNKTDNTSQQSQLRLLNFDNVGVEFRVGRLSQYCVEGIWSNLNLELLYLTSDDDERFSIQHDRYLMRNVSTQCANSPLGYAVYDATYKIHLFDNTIQPVT